MSKGDRKGWSAWRGVEEDRPLGWIRCTGRQNGVMGRQRGQIWLNECKGRQKGAAGCTGRIDRETS